MKLSRMASSQRYEYTRVAALTIMENERPGGTIIPFGPIIGVPSGNVKSSSLKSFRGATTLNEGRSGMATVATAIIHAGGLGSGVASYQILLAQSL